MKKKVLSLSVVNIAIFLISSCGSELPKNITGSSSEYSQAVDLTGVWVSHSWYENYESCNLRTTGQYVFIPNDDNTKIDIVRYKGTVLGQDNYGCALIEDNSENNTWQGRPIKQSYNQFLEYLQKNPLAQEETIQLVSFSNTRILSVIYNTSSGVSYHRLITRDR